MKTSEQDVVKNKNERLNSIGRRIKSIRENLHLSQRKMAASLNTSASYLSEIEGGKANPGPGFFLDLSSVFNVSIEYIFHGAGEMFCDSKTRLPKEQFKEVHNIDSLEKLVWLMNHSSLFKNSLLAYAAQYFLEHEAIIKKNMEREKNRDK